MKIGRKVFLLFLVIGVITFFSCTTAENKERKALAKKLEKNNTVLIIPMGVKNETEYQLFASFVLTVKNRKTGEKVRDIELSHSGDYTIVAGMSPGEYAVTHIKFKMYSDRKTPETYLLGSDFDTYYPFDIVADSISATEFACLKHLYRDEKTKLLAYVLQMKFSGGILAVSTIKHFFIDYPDLAYFRRGQIEIGLLINKEKEITGTRFWDLEKNKLYVAIP